MVNSELRHRHATAVARPCVSLKEAFRKRGVKPDSEDSFGDRAGKITRVEIDLTSAFVKSIGFLNSMYSH